jgi:hypothetical protein
VSVTATREVAPSAAIGAEARPAAPRLWPGLLLAAIVYLGVSLVIWWRVWVTGDPGHTLTCPCGDVAVQVWWLEWLPRALQHGHNPFYSNAQFARFGGINAMLNTNLLLPAALLAPVTLLAGPIASSNVANLLAPVATGVAAYALAARFTTRTASRLVAGLAYAFSPFVLGNVDVAHVNLTMLAYTPLVLLVGDRLLRGETSPRRAGVLLGALTVLEALTGLEGVAITAGLVSCCLVALALVRRGVLVDAWRGLAQAAAVAGSIVVVVLAYPAAVFLAGPARVRAPFWTSTATLGVRQFLWPPPLVHAPIHSAMVAGYEGARGPGTQFLGVGIVLVVVLGALVVRRRAPYAVLGIAAALCLVVEANPLRLFQSIPLLNDVVPVRFAIGTTLCLAVMLAMVVDGWLVPERRLPVAARSLAGRAAGPLAALACVAIAVAPVVATYTVPFKVAAVAVPRWFTTAGARIPSGTAALVFPFAWSSSDTAMVWQAESGLHLALVGGFGYVPGANGRPAAQVSPLPDASLLQAVSRGDPPPSAATRARLRALLASWAPLEVVVIEGRARPSVVETLTAALGERGVRADGATTWTLRARRAAVAHGAARERVHRG